MSINFCQIRENIKIMRSSCRCHNLKRKQSKILKIKLICKFVVFHYVAHCTTLDEFFKVPCHICFSTSGSFQNVKHFPVGIFPKKALLFKFKSVHIGY